MTSIAKSAAPVLIRLLTVTMAASQNQGLVSLFNKNPEILGCRDAGQNKKIDAVVVPEYDYLSI